MIKKLIAFIGLGLLAGAGYGEDLNFLTVLSSPIGTFANLETADEAGLTQAPQVNFCTTQANGGEITLAGSAAPSLGNITLHDGAVLSGNAKEMRLTGLTLSDKGTVSGKHLLANAVTVSAPSEHNVFLEATRLYVPSVTVPAAKVDKLKIGTDQFVLSATGDSETLIWTNDYQKDYSLESSQQTVNSDYAAQFLLKGGARREITPLPYTGSIEDIYNAFEKKDFSALDRLSNGQN